MTEYISRDAAIANSREYNLGGSYDNTELAVPVDAINSIPAADVRPVVLGKWVFCGGTWEGANTFKCSECGKSVYHEETNYCPNCGAMMEES